MEDKIKCGQIYILSTDNFSLICEFCAGEYFTLPDLHSHLDEHLLRTPINIKKEDSISCGSDSECVPLDKTNVNMTDIENFLEIPVNSDCESIPPELHDYMMDFKDVVKYEADSEATSSKLYYNQYKDKIIQSEQNVGQQLGNENDIEPKEKKDADTNRQPKRVRKKKMNDISTDNKSNCFEKRNSIELPPNPIPRKSASRELECRYCCKKIKGKRERDEHENTHTGNRPYVCRICSRTFASSANLFSHLQWHENDRKYQCSLCDTSFVRRARFDDHTREKHLPDTDPRRYFPCQQCDAKLQSRSKLQLHRRTHRKYSDYFYCDHCPKNFNMKIKLVDHMVVHSGVKRYACKFCNLKFLHRSDYYKHQRKCKNEIFE